MTLALKPGPRAGHRVVDGLGERLWRGRRPGADGEGEAVSGHAEHEHRAAQSEQAREGEAAEEVQVLRCRGRSTAVFTG